MSKGLSVCVSARSDLVCGPSKFNWGDFWVKENLLAAFAMHGCQILGRPPAKLNVFCWGRSPAKRIPKQGINFAWFYSRPEQMTRGELESFDLVFCTSERYVREANRKNVIHMDVCSHLFRSSNPVIVPDCPDVVFIGNARRGHGGRPIAHALMQPLPFTVGVWGIGYDSGHPCWLSLIHI